MPLAASRLKVSASESGACGREALLGPFWGGVGGVGWGGGGGGVGCGVGWGGGGGVPDILRSVLCDSTNMGCPFKTTLQQERPILGDKGRLRQLSCRVVEGFGGFEGLLVIPLGLCLFLSGEGETRFADQGKSKGHV